jgi:hypothetical protein
MKRLIMAAAVSVIGFSAAIAAELDQPAIGQLYGSVPVGRELARQAASPAVPIPDQRDWTGEIRWEMVPLNKSGFPQAKPSYSKREFCTRARDYGNFQSLILDAENRLSFVNAGGLGGKGVCWWHSHLTQRQIYLTVFRPELPKPSKEQVRDIFDGYFRTDRVVEIPGYANFYDFSNDWREFLQKKLNEWQILDALTFGWVDGLTGGTHIAPKRFKADMDALFAEVSGKKRIIWQKLQFPGIASHAWLVVGMAKEANGYALSVVDSNYGYVRTHHYREGDDSLHVEGYPAFAPYTEFLGDFDRFRRAHIIYCSKSVAGAD